jgi:hypothetical protein
MQKMPVTISVSVISVTVILNSHIRNVSSRLLITSQASSTL